MEPEQVHSGVSLCVTKKIDLWRRLIGCRPFGGAIRRPFCRRPTGRPPIDRLTSLIRGTKNPTSHWLLGCGQPIRGHLSKTQGMGQEEEEKNKVHSGAFLDDTKRSTFGDAWLVVVHWAGQSGVHSVDGQQVVPYRRSCEFNKGHEKSNLSLVAGLPLTNQGPLLRSRPLCWFLFLQLFEVDSRLLAAKKKSTKKKPNNTRGVDWSPPRNQVGIEPKKNTKQNKTKKKPCRIASDCSPVKTR